MADPSENACVERLTPKTVPMDLVALGTITDISAQLLKLQITNGIVCLVDRCDISQPLTKHIKHQEAHAKEAPRLIDLFKIGQQYVCKVIDRKTRKGYAEAQDIIATLDPNRIQESSIASTLFGIPYVPIQGAILSVEDHGYRVDIGFKNLTGFLSFEDAKDEGRKFAVGQIIRCSTKALMEDDTRIIQLSRRLNKLTRFDQDKCGQCSLTPNCILPGSKGFLTVMKVQKDGLIVNFLDEFAGFVRMDHLKSNWQDPKSKFKIADRIKCSVLYYNTTTNLFALSLVLKQFKSTLKRLINDYYIGQMVNDARVVTVNGLRSILFHVGDLKAIVNPRDALNEDVGTMTKDEISAALDSSYPDGSAHKARIKSINYADLVLILSLRQGFLEQSCVSLKELEPADFLEVTIKKHVKDGIVVSFGLNLRGIILNTFLKDYQSAKSHKRYPIGKTIKSRVLKVDTEKYPNRVYLTNMDELMDPDMMIVDGYDKSYRGAKVNAVVVKLKHDGLIVELFNNVKGFVPRRFCSSTPIRTVGGLFQIGQIVSCTVYRIEPDRQSMLLGIIPLEKIIAVKKELRMKKLRNKELKGGQSQAKKKRIAKPDSEPAEREPGGDEESKEMITETTHDKDEEEDDEEVPMEISPSKPKSRLQRNIEKKLREEARRMKEEALSDRNRQPKSIADFKMRIQSSPGSAGVWIEFSEFLLDNVETESARAVCRDALKTINIREGRERLKIWLQLIKIEAKFGGLEQMRAVIEEAAQTNDRLVIYQKAAQTLVSCKELNEAELLHERALKLSREVKDLGERKRPDIWLNYIVFLMEHKKDLNKARQIFEQALKSSMVPSDLIYLRSRFARLECMFGEVERGRTLFENLLSEKPKRMDIWNVYVDAIRKFGGRQMDTEEVNQQCEHLLQRIDTLKK